MEGLQKPSIFFARSSKGNPNEEERSKQNSCSFKFKTTKKKSSEKSVANIMRFDNNQTPQIKKRRRINCRKYFPCWAWCKSCVTSKKCSVPIEEMKKNGGLNWLKRELDLEEDFTWSKTDQREIELGYVDLIFKKELLTHPFRPRDPNTIRQCSHSKSATHYQLQRIKLPKQFDELRNIVIDNLRSKKHQVRKILMDLKLNTPTYTIDETRERTEALLFLATGGVQKVKNLPLPDEYKIVKNEDLEENKGKDLREYRSSAPSVDVLIPCTRKRKVEAMSEGKDEGINYQEIRTSSILSVCNPQNESNRYGNFSFRTSTNTNIVSPRSGFCSSSKVQSPQPEKMEKDDRWFAIQMSQMNVDQLEKIVGFLKQGFPFDVAFSVVFEGIVDDSVKTEPWNNDPGYNKKRRFY